ncbi:MAG TPA: hypothetical protein VMM84_06925 [Pyrinomonadaceae bacterium]|nr:hypothetical protein [Pyrinomonadaceae bacterium]
MTATQLAEYWQLYNDKNEPTTAALSKSRHLRAIVRLSTYQPNNTKT